MSERPEWLWTGAAAGAVSAIGSFVLAVAVQQPALDFFYEAFAGGTHSDGPILIVLAYVLAIPAAIVVYIVTRKIWTRAQRSVAGACIGPLLMVVTAALSAWLDHRPPR